MIIYVVTFSCSKPIYPRCPTLCLKLSYLINNLVFSLLKWKILWWSAYSRFKSVFIYYTFPKFCPCGGAADSQFRIILFKTKNMLVQLDGAIAHILTMLNDVARFIVIKRVLAHSDKKVGHPGHICICLLEPFLDMRLIFKSKRWI